MLAALVRPRGGSGLIWTAAPVSAGPEVKADHMYYARIVFKTNASVAEKHAEFQVAWRWIEDERRTSNGSFRFGQILEGTPALEVVATCDPEGWEGS